MPEGGDFLPRYPHGNRNQPGSEPDLIVILDPRGGKKVYIAIEVERAKRATPMTKMKMHKTLSDWLSNSASAAEKGLAGYEAISHHKGAAVRYAEVVRKYLAEMMTS